VNWSNRLRNYGFWISLAALVLMLLKAFGVYIGDQQFNEIVNAILGILVLLGIINNPTTNNKGYMDDQSQDGIN
jgi:phi LC3 family holin